MAKKTHEEFIKELKIKNDSFREGLFTLTNKYTTSSNFIFITDEFGKHKLKPLDLLKNTAGNVRSTLDKTDYWVKRAKKNRTNSNKIDYSKVKYNGVKNKVELRCIIHDYEYKQRTTHHMSNVQGCPLCSTTTVRYSIQNFESHKEFFKKRKGYFYIVKLSNSIESFYKIGITSRLKYRLKQYKKYFEVELIYKEEGSIEDMFNIEQTTLKEFIKYKYEPKFKFKGYTECLSVEPKEMYAESYFYKKEQDKMFCEEYGINYENNLIP